MSRSTRRGLPRWMQGYLPPAFVRRLAGDAPPHVQGQISEDDRAIVTWALREGMGRALAARLLGEQPDVLEALIEREPSFAALCREAIAAGKAEVAAKLPRMSQESDTETVRLWLDLHDPELTAGISLGRGEER